MGSCGLAEYGGAFYRARVVLMPAEGGDGKAEVLFVDFGNSTRITPAEIFSFGADYTLPTMPALCVAAELDDGVVKEQMVVDGK